jgi:Ca-activated chloride channel family protein
MKSPFYLTVALLSFVSTAVLAQVTAPQDQGSLSMKVQLENTYVHNHEPVVHALIGLKAGESTTSRALPLNLSLVIDRSGSMQGQKIVDARQAALSMVDRLRRGDRVSIVSYSDDARVDVRSTVVNQRSRRTIKRAIRRISASGSTFLSGGLEAGIREARRHLRGDQANRVLLISDGLANQGVTHIPELNRIVRTATQDGIATTTLGLGADYNEDLMTAVANHGGGNYYFVERSEELASVLDQELDQMMATVAGGATLELSLEDGVTVEEVFGYAWNKKGKRTEIRLGDLFAGQRRSVLVKLRVPRTVGSKALGNFTLLYDDMTEGGERGSTNARANIQVTSDRKLIRENRNDEVEARIGEIELATQMQEAARMVEDGRYDDAKGILHSAKKQAYSKGASLGVLGAGLRGSAAQADELIKRLESAPSSPKQRKALIKRSKGKAYKLQKQ